VRGIAPGVHLLNGTGLVARSAAQFDAAHFDGFDGVHFAYKYGRFCLNGKGDTVDKKRLHI
jgi:hypothetical protein